MCVTIFLIHLFDCQSINNKLIIYVIRNSKPLKRGETVQEKKKNKKKTNALHRNNDCMKRAIGSLRINNDNTFTVETLLYMTNIQNIKVFCQEIHTFFPYMFTIRNYICGLTLCNSIQSLTHSGT